MYRELLCAIKSDDNTLACSEEYIRNVDMPLPKNFTTAPGLIDVAIAGPLDICAIKAIDNAIECYIGDADNDPPYLRRDGIPPGEFTSIAATVNTVCAIPKDDPTTVVCFGSPGSVELIIPKEIRDGNSKIKQLASGLSHYCVILEDDSELICWGNNQYGKLAPEYESMNLV